MTPLEGKSLPQRSGNLSRMQSLTLKIIPPVALIVTSVQRLCKIQLSHSVVTCIAGPAFTYGFISREYLMKTNTSSVLYAKLKFLKHPQSHSMASAKPQSVLKAIRRILVQLYLEDLLVLVVELTYQDQLTQLAHTKLISNFMMTVIHIKHSNTTPTQTMTLHRCLTELVR